MGCVRLSKTRGYEQAFLDAANRGDPTAMRRHLVDAADVNGLGACVDQVLFPAMRRIGSWRESDRCSLSTERLAIETARVWLDWLVATAPAPAVGAPILLACAPRDVHTLGLEALGMLLRYRRQGCRMLGAKTSATSLAVAVRANRPAGVVVVAQLESGWLDATQALHAVARLEPQLFYAGRAFSSARQRRALPGTYLGTTLERAALTILAAIRTR
jgi:hypothetical protein